VRVDRIGCELGLIGILNCSQKERGKLEKDRRRVKLS
jgi:hypothetical protein